MQIIVRLALIALASVVIIIGLYRYSIRNAEMPSGFNRKFPSHVVGRYKVFDLGVNSYYIAGYTAGAVWLGNRTVPNRLLRVDTNFTDTVHFQLEIPSRDTMWGEVKMVIDSPLMYMTQNRRPSLRVAMFDNRIPLSSSLVTDNVLELLPLSSSSVVGKSFDISQNEMQLFKEQVTPEHITARHFMGKGSAAVFLADGNFTQPAGRNRFFYTYFYQNQFLCLDSNLNLIYKRNTIDTCKTPIVPLTTYNGSRTTTLASAPRMVNKTCFASDSLLFIQSAVRSDHEDAAGFKTTMTIDCYNAASGKYLFSVSIVPYKSLKCLSINIYNNTIFAVFERYLVSINLYPNNYRGLY